MMISIKAILPFTDLDLQSPIFEKISRSTAVPDMTPEPDKSWDRRGRPATYADKNHSAKAQTTSLTS